MFALGCIVLLHCLHVCLFVCLFVLFDVFLFVRWFGGLLACLSDCLYACWVNLNIALCWRFLAASIGGPVLLMEQLLASQFLLLILRCHGLRAPVTALTCSRMPSPRQKARAHIVTPFFSTGLKDLACAWLFFLFKAQFQATKLEFLQGG